MSNNDPKEGDQIVLDYGFKTKLLEIKYCPFAKVDLYWFLNERGERKYNLKEFIKKAE